METTRALKFGSVKTPVVKFYDAKEAHISAYLSQVSKMLKNEAFIWDQLFPRFAVVKDKDKVPVYQTEHLKRLITDRAPKTQSNMATRHLGTAIEYECTAKALHDLCGDEEKVNADPPIKPEVDTMEFVTNLIELDLEFRAYDSITTTGNYASSSHYRTLVAGEQWDDFVNSDPLANIETAKIQIYNACGKKANRIMLPYKVATKICRHPDILELRKYTDPNLLTAGGLPPVLQNLRVVEADAIYDTAMQGQTANLSGLWSDYVWIGFVNPRMGLKDTTWGVCFDRGGRIVRTWYEQKVKATWIEVEEQGLDLKIFDNRCGYLLIDVLS